MDQLTLHNISIEDFLNQLTKIILAIIEECIILFLNLNHTLPINNPSSNNNSKNQNYNNNRHFSQTTLHNQIYSQTTPNSQICSQTTLHSQISLLMISHNQILFQILAIFSNLKTHRFLHQKTCSMEFKKRLHKKTPMFLKIATIANPFIREAHFIDDIIKIIFFNILI